MEIVSTVHHNSPSRLRAKSPLWQPFCYSSALHWGQKIRHLRKFLRIVCKLSVSIMSCCSWLGLWFYMSVETAPWVKLLTAPGCHRWGACWGTEQHFVNSWQNLNRWSYGLWNEMVLKCAASPAHLLATGRGGSEQMSCCLPGRWSSHAPCCAGSKRRCILRKSQTSQDVLFSISSEQHCLCAVLGGQSWNKTRRKAAEVKLSLKL